jgi:hypothetical protein
VAKPQLVDLGDGEAVRAAVEETLRRQPQRPIDIVNRQPWP